MGKIREWFIDRYLRISDLARPAFSTWLIRPFRKLPRIVRLFLYVVFFSFLIFCLFDALFPFKPEVNYTQVVLDKNDNLLHAFLSVDQKWRMRSRLEEINPKLVKVIVRKEDRWFWIHPGVNGIAILRAAWQNISRGERVSGASTITMQVVRLLKPAKRTHLNKLLEMFRALQLEFHHSKKEILELYLNLLPYGGNIEGVKAASYLYFGQKPLALSPAQLVTLAVIPNNPKHLRLGENNAAIKTERNRWLGRMWKFEVFTKEEIEPAIQEPLDVQRIAAPKSLPHFAWRVRKNNSSSVEYQTFIDPELQSNIEQILSSEVRRLRSLGIANGAVVVINNHTGGVEAYLGSAGFNENQYLGQVDGCMAIRSPGSALKPFLYAQAIDKGMITPKTIISDIPMDFNGYRPQNYDETYRGQLTVAQALALSLNVPAVELANQMGVDQFVDKLANGGLKWIAGRKKSLGLSVVLGGCGVNLLELTSLYSSLACGGLHYPVRLTRDAHKEAPDTLFSPEAAWLVTDMLTNLKRPDLPNSFESSIHLPHIAWKTGTSYGRRDAWTIGYNPDYTVGVWVGNFDGSGVPDLSGSECAAPIVFKVFNLLGFRKQTKWFLQSKGLDFRLVCSESGLPPNDFCENLVMDYYIPAVSSNHKCNHLKEVFTNPSGSMSYCRSCLPETGYRSEYFPNLQPALLTYYLEEQIPFRRIPPHNPDCIRISKDTEPVITSLSNGKEYILYSNSGHQLQLACNTSADVTTVYWYINNVFYKEGKATEKLFFTPGQGFCKISCCDDKGRNSDIMIKVTFL